MHRRTEQENSFELRLAQIASTNNTLNMVELRKMPEFNDEVLAYSIKYFNLDEYEKKLISESVNNSSAFIKGETLIEAFKFEVIREAWRVIKEAEKSKSKFPQTPYK
jgi:hypothetical protein